MLVSLRVTFFLNPDASETGAHRSTPMYALISVEYAECMSMSFYCIPLILVVRPMTPAGFSSADSCNPLFVEPLSALNQEHLNTVIFLIL